MVEQVGRQTEVLGWFSQYLGYIIDLATMKMNDIKYSEKIFAFLDILGFERIVNESKSNPKLISTIRSMLARSKQIAESNLNAKLTVLQVNSSEYTYRTFSDTSTISGPYISHDDMSFLSMWIMFYQYLMWKEERTFVRGTIVYGDIYEDKDVIFGPALIDAYHLETSKASWPRVLVGKSLLNKITDTERARDFYEFLRQDDDSLVYLDYLREIFHLRILAENKKIIGERTQDFGAPIELFKDHKEAILTQVDITSKEENKDEGKNILRKYMKLSKYHNSTIDRLRQVIKELTTNDNLIHEVYNDQLKFDKAKNLGMPYEPKYSAEEHPEQSDMLDILVLVTNRLIENPPPDNLEIHGIVIARRVINPGPDDFAVERAINAICQAAPRELLILDKSLQELMVDINKLGLNV